MSVINIPQAIDRLCYRYPSPLVDAVTEHEPGRRIKAVKNVTVNEDFFQGHFPGAPLMPGVLMIETLAQVATILLTHAPQEPVVGRALPGVTITLQPDSVAIRTGEFEGAADIVLPAEAFVRLVYGRLDVDHTPAFEGNNATLDELRRVFPGI